VIEIQEERGEKCERRKREHESKEEDIKTTSCCF
jgi:hypothetical protein